MTDVPLLFRVAAEPARWRLLTELASGDLPVGELAERTGLRENLASYHLGVLRRAGIVSARQNGRDGRGLFYRLDLERCSELLDEPRHDLLGSVAVQSSKHRPRHRKRVLFLCTENSARSQMAEGFLRVSATDVNAESAGTHPSRLHPAAVREMARRGIDISSHRSKHVAELTEQHFDVVVTVCDLVRAESLQFEGSPARVHWSVVDPALIKPRSNAFRVVADELALRVKHLVSQELAAD